MSIEYKDAVICTGQSNMTILLQALIDAGVDSGVWVSGEAQGGQYLANNTWLSLATPWTRSNYYNQIIAKQGGRKYKRLVSVFWQGESDTDTNALSLTHAAKVEQYHRFLAQDLLEEGGQLFEIIVLPWNTSIGNGTEYTNVRNGLINYVNKSPNTRVYIDSKDWTRYDLVHVNNTEHKKYSYLYTNAINNFLSRSYGTTGGEHATVQYVKELLNVVGGGNVTAPTSSVTVGSLTVFDSTDGKKIKALANGSNSQVLSMSGGLPTWVTLTAGSGDVTGTGSSPPIGSIATYSTNTTGKNIGFLSNASTVKWLKMGTDSIPVLEDAATTILNLTRVRDEASASMTLQNSDNGSIIRTTNTSGAITISIPAGLTGNFSCMIIQGTTQAVTIQAVGGSGVAINSFSNYTKLAGQYATATILEVASNVYILAGNLIA
jgi:hypothetical protein